MRGVLVFATWLALLPFCFARAYVGVLVWVWTALFAPNNEVFGFMAMVPFNKVIAGVTFISIAISKDSKKIKLDGILLLLLLFLGHGLLSYFLSADNTAGADTADRMWKIALLCVFINMLITDRLRLHALIWIVVIAVGFHGIVEGLKFLVTGGTYHLGAIASLGDNNYVAAGFLMLMPLPFYLWRTSIYRLAKYAALVTTLLTCCGVLATYSRGGFIGLVAVGVTLCITGRRKLRSLFFVLALAAAIVAVGPEQWFARVSTVETAEKDSSFMSRIFMWNVSYLIASDHPLLGDGYYATQNISIFRHYENTAVGMGGDDPHRPLASHSIYFEALADQGVVGLLLFLMLLALGFYNAQKIIRFAKPEPDLRWIYDLAQMLRLSLVGFAVAGASVSATYMEFYYIELSILAILARFCRQLVAEAQGERNLLDSNARLSSVRASL